MPTSPIPPRIAVVIPCYRVRAQIVGVVSGLPPWIDRIFAVDDACPEKSGQHLKEHSADPRLQVLFHTQNRGVGGAMISGYQAALAADCDIVVKMDGDNQMDPTYLPRLIQPIITGHADFTKGNRFYDLSALRQMPPVRRAGKELGFDPFITLAPVDANLTATRLICPSSGWHRMTLLLCSFVPLHQEH